MPTKSLASIAQAIPTIAKNPKLLAIFEKTMMLGKPSYREIRGREIDPNAKGAQGSNIDIAMTYLLCVAQVLAYHKTSPEPCNILRYAPADKDCDGPVYVGYSAEDWSRAMFTVATFINFRRPKYAVDGQNGPGSKKSPVPWVKAEEEKILLGPEDEDTSLDNVHYCEGLEYTNALKRFTSAVDELTNADDDKSDETDETDETDERMRSITAQINYLVGVNPGTSLSTTIAKRRQDNQQVNPPPASYQSITNMLSHLQDKMKTIEVSGEDSYHALATLSDLGRSENMNRFLATQTHLAECLATQREEGRQDLPEASYSAAIDEIKRGFAIDNRLSRQKPEEVDLKDAVEAAGFEREKWDDLTVDPKAPDFKLMPHQVVGKCPKMTPAGTIISFFFFCADRHDLSVSFY